MYRRKKEETASIHVDEAGEKFQRLFHGFEESETLADL